MLGGCIIVYYINKQITITSYKYVRLKRIRQVPAFDKDRPESCLFVPFHGFSPCLRQAYMSFLLNSAAWLCPFTGQENPTLTGIFRYQWWILPRKDGISQFQCYFRHFTNSIYLNILKEKNIWNNVMHSALKHRLSLMPIKNDEVEMS